MLVFLNCAGVEPIANAAGDGADQERSLPLARIGGLLPHCLERTIRGEQAEGMLVCAVPALGNANFVPPDAIATMGRAGFLIVFMRVNLANVRRARETASRARISSIATICTAAAPIVPGVTVDENPATRRHLWGLAGLVVASLAFETACRLMSRRHVRLISPRHRPGARTSDPSPRQGRATGPGAKTVLTETA